MAHIYMPKTQLRIDGPLIFLAGPIRGAPSWQNEAIGNLLMADFGMNIATPTRSIAPEWASLVLHGRTNYSRQREWEDERMEQAALGPLGGAIMFWLTGEVDHRCEKAYGRMTSVEYGLWLMRYSMDRSTRIVLGSDGTFSEVDTMMYDRQRYAPDLPVYTTLEETCDAALKLARKR